MTTKPKESAEYRVPCDCGATVVIFVGEDGKPSHRIEPAPEESDPIADMLRGGKKGEGGGGE